MGCIWNSLRIQIAISVAFQSTSVHQIYDVDTWIPNIWTADWNIVWSVWGLSRHYLSSANCEDHTLQTSIHCQKLLPVNGWAFSILWQWATNVSTLTGSPRGETGESGVWDRLCEDLHHYGTFQDPVKSKKKKKKMNTTQNPPLLISPRKHSLCRNTNRQ